MRKDGKLKGTKEESPGRNAKRLRAEFEVGGLSGAERGDEQSSGCEDHTCAHVCRRVGGMVTDVHVAILFQAAAHLRTRAIVCCTSCESHAGVDWGAVGPLVLCVELRVKDLGKMLTVLEDILLATQSALKKSPMKSSLPSRPWHLCRSANHVLGLPSCVPKTADAVRTLVKLEVTFWSVCSVGRCSFLRLEEDMVLNLLDELRAALQQGSRLVGLATCRRLSLLLRCTLRLDTRLVKAQEKGASLTPCWTAPKCCTQIQRLHALGRSLTW